LPPTLLRPSNARPGDHQLEPAGSANGRNGDDQLEPAAWGRGSEGASASHVNRGGSGTARRVALQQAIAPPNHAIAPPKHAIAPPQHAIAPPKHASAPPADAPSRSTVIAALPDAAAHASLLIAPPYITPPSAHTSSPPSAGTDTCAQDSLSSPSLAMEPALQSGAPDTDVPVGVATDVATGVATSVATGVATGVATDVATGVEGSWCGEASFAGLDCTLQRTPQGQLCFLLLFFPLVLSASSALQPA
jgi:hypothetical protein